MSIPPVTEQRCLKRANHRCEVCGFRQPRGVRRNLLTCHHILQVHKGGEDVEENLLVVCQNCHAVADSISSKLDIGIPREEMIAQVQEQYGDHLIRTVYWRDDGEEIQESRNQAALGQRHAGEDRLRDSAVLSVPSEK